MNTHHTLIVALLELGARVPVSRDEWATALTSERLAAVVVALVSQRLPGRRDGSGRFVKEEAA